MKTKLTRLLAVLMSVLMLTLPTLASAEAFEIYATISDPKLSVGEATIDLAGLSLECTAEQAEDATSLLLNLLASGQKAVSVHAAFGEKGIQAYIEGMSSAFVVSPEAIKALGEQMIQASGMSGMLDMNKLGSFDLSTMISEEALGKFMNTVQQLASEVIQGEPVEDKFVTLSGAEVAASRIDFKVTPEHLAAIVDAEIELIESSPISEQIHTALEQQGQDAPLKDLVNVDPDNLPTIEGSIFYSTESQDLHVEGSVTVDESSAPLTIDFSQTDEGTFATGSLKQPDEGSQELAFQFSATPSTAVEIEAVVNGEIGLYDHTDDGVETIFCFTVSAYAEPAGNDSVTHYLLLNGEAEDNTFSFSFTTCNDPENESVVLAFSADSDGEKAVFSLDFNGKAVQSDKAFGHEGILSLSVESNGQAVSFQTGLAFGVCTAEDSIAFDFSGLPAIDVTSITEESAEGLQNELMGVVQNALGALMQVPGVSALMSSMQAQG